MNTRQAWIGCGTAAVLAGAYATSDLVAVWTDSPYDRYGGLAACVWMSAVVWLLVRTEWNPEPTWCASGIGCMALGMMVDISVVVHAGLALTIAGFPAIAATRRCMLVVSALSWMPVLGWVASGWVSTGVCSGGRVAWALLAWATVGGKK